MFFTISAVFNRYKFCIKQLHPRYGNVTKLLQTSEIYKTCFNISQRVQYNFEPISKLLQMPENSSLPQTCYKNIDYFHKTK